MQNNNNHPDPYAGQYPLPPPFVGDHHYFPENTHYAYPPQTHATAPSPPVSLPPPQQQLPVSLPQPEVYVPPPEVYVPPPPPPPPVANDYYPHHTTPPQEDYHDPQGQSLDAYLRQEREEYLRHQTEEPRPTVIPLDSYKNEQEEEAPMVEKHEYLGRKERKRLKKQQAIEAQYEPHLARPTYAPLNEAETYRYRPQEDRGRSPCCCCYNPAITCCSFFMLLVSCAFLAAGVAMMIGSKVVQDKCNNECTNVSDSIANACSTVCNKVLHDGLLYGGAVVAGLAGIAIIWKIVMWTCAGYSQRR